MAPVCRWGCRISPVALLYATAEEASCPENVAASGESGCSTTPEGPFDFIPLVDDIAALNRSVGNKLHPIRRVPCSGDWYTADEPVILEGCCWALQSAFEQGEEVEDCSTDEDFLPLDHLDISHQYFRDHCSGEDFTFWQDHDHYRNYITSLQFEPREVQDDIDRGLRDAFNVTLSELTAMAMKRRSMARYNAEKQKFQVHHRPKHILGYFNPLSYGAMKFLWCPALEQQLIEKGFPMLSLYRQLRRFPYEQEDRRKNSWVDATTTFVVPKAGFALPAHLHFEQKASAVLLTEGKKHWQFMEATPESYSDLQPIQGMRRLEHGFQKVPIDLADEYPVYIGTQAKGEVMIPPRNWVHLAYSIEDSVSVVFSPRK